jgi:dUTP pyrophosphatase
LKVKVKVKRLDPGLPLPRFAHPGDAGVDLYSTVDLVIKPGMRQIVPTGISISLPRGWAAFVQPRSGLAAKYGITIVNTPGLIDSGYRGEIKVILLNTDRENSFEIKRGDKIAQMVVQQVAEVEWEEVDELDPTSRGTGGFGSTGI